MSETEGQQSATGTGPHAQTGWAPGPGYPPPGYGQPGYGQPWHPVARTSTQSMVVLGLGVASLTVLWGIAGIVALFLAPGAKREIAAAQGQLGGSGLIRAGVICSWISIVLTVLVILAVVAFLVAFGVSAAEITVNETVTLTPTTSLP